MVAQVLPSVANVRCNILDGTVSISVARMRGEKKKYYRPPKIQRFTELCLTRESKGGRFWMQ